MNIYIVLQNISKHVSDGHKRIMIYIDGFFRKESIYVNTVCDSSKLKLYIQIENFMKKILHKISFN